ncbi:Protein KRE1 [Spathaspora sp. JA1]|nr:Protein KRE1 [Spathaspora sp. JA1]
MKFNLLSLFFLCISLVIAADPPTTTSVTLVWVTGTDAAGNLVTTQSIFSQSFQTFFTQVATPSSGAIGLGSLSGSVGDIKTYDLVTITHAAGGVSSFALGLGSMDLSITKCLGVSFIALFSLILFI